MSKFTMDQFAAVIELGIDLGLLWVVSTFLAAQPAVQRAAQPAAQAKVQRAAQPAARAKVQRAAQPTARSPAPEAVLPVVSEAR
ncbi:hypothetical protein ACOBQB_31790 [Streptomyces sp. G5(2025)]|uniref:hypothetical protein n=1 Tax=Streptomyces sp. G5(2025) TaxID=3406628 RepID=UPI003C2A4C28